MTEAIEVALSKAISIIEHLSNPVEYFKVLVILDETNAGLYISRPPERISRLNQLTQGGLFELSSIGLIRTATGNHVFDALKKLTYEERKAKLTERLHTLNAAAGADSEDED
ncbi:hypothetical protein Goklo_015270 [Gossypium klotzschianum]|uniref:Uncharacterized protein n=1 Tax=Gossypium klotzschianum TaxID=34286 RepID=A0A7J8UA48_9ROSI|nr:hypothetical protein [Gossypium klotzschianum]